MSIKIRGLDELQRQLKSLAERAAAVSGEHSIPIGELLTPKFMAGCSLCNSSDELFTKGGVKFESPEEFEAIPRERMDEVTRNNTRFATWEEMLHSAGAEWTREHLGLSS
jgi:hypothetical protein